MERSKAGTKKKVRRPVTIPNQNTILINIKLYYFIIYGKITNAIQLTKNKMDLNNLKIKNHPSSPGWRPQGRTRFATTQRWAGITLKCN